MRWALLVGLGTTVLGALLVGGMFLYYTSDPSLPTIDRVGDYRPKVTTRVLARDGQLIGEIFEERRTVVPLVSRDKDERGRPRLVGAPPGTTPSVVIPRLVADAFVAAEDAQFYEHPGLDTWSMVRAMLHNLRPGAHLHGASTITQQLVRTYILRSDARTLKRKVQEMYLALRLERRLSKEEILWIYLNQIYFGHGRYGVEEAARFYFGRSVNQLGLAEAALLAALPKGPEEISPRRNPQRAKDRQRYVLSQMVRYRYTTREAAQRAAERPIQIVPEPAGLAALAPEFVDEVERYLVERYTRERLPYLGLEVRTSCDLAAQRAAREALERGLDRLDERNGHLGPLRHLSPPQQGAYLKELAHAYPNGPPPGRIVEGVVQQVFDGDGLSGAGASVALGTAVGWLPLPARPGRYNPKGLLPSRRFQPGDVLRVRIASSGKDGPVLALENGPQGALVALEPESRHVVALVGGYGFGRGQFNRALRARRQPGSAFKPFVYAAAFDYRGDPDGHRYTPATLLNDSPQVYDLPGMAPWKPQNAERQEYLGPVRLRVALARSLNTVASQLIYHIKPGPVAAMARAAGIESDLEETYALALGASEVTPLELTNAYATLAASGRRQRPVFILQVGSEVLAPPPAEQGLSPDLAFVVTSVLRSVIEEGTAVAARGKLGRPAAGKTGTTNAQRDAWFVGYTPELVAGVWVGHDDMRVLGEREQGARAALPIWLEFMQRALVHRKPSTFVQPPGVVVQRIDPRTGKLAPPGAPAVEEVFLAGTEPTEQALLPGESDPDTYYMHP
ncbi:MAG: PBP1A family penicillin-binding protein [Myxococcales bacterium]|nr:PBP1A family penicillin-binding protein [Myxococcota bacterium]MDW8280976.1 PBP1A family penicillin-binding protein [Myxococcales bacterium]